MGEVLAQPNLGPQPWTSTVTYILEVIDTISLKLSTNGNLNLT